MTRVSQAHFQIGEMSHRDVAAHGLAEQGRVRLPSKLLRFPTGDGDGRVFSLGQSGRSIPDQVAVLRLVFSEWVERTVFNTDSAQFLFSVRPQHHVKLSFFRRLYGFIRRFCVGHFRRLERGRDYACRRRHVRAGLASRPVHSRDGSAQLRIEF